MKPPEILGLAGLYEAHQKNVANGKRIFDLVMQEKADARALAGIVDQESLLQLIFYVIDHGKAVTSAIRGQAGNEQRKEKQTRRQAILNPWFEKNVNNVKPQSRKWLFDKFAREQRSFVVNERTFCADLVGWEASQGIVRRN
jgi:hypothetical protein